MWLYPYIFNSGEDSEMSTCTGVAPVGNTYIIQKRIVRCVHALGLYL